jgi:uncharacterized LabA/DUF88 family protein
MHRALWLIDGFNLYHSLLRSEREAGRNLRWLNLWDLAQNAQASIGSSYRLHRIEYFTALPHHLVAPEPGKLERHKAYLRALTAWRPACEIQLGHFQPHDEGGKVWREKGTDMAIAAAAFRAAIKGEAEEIVIVSGDSDFVPLAQLMRELFPYISLRFAFPAHRASRKLAKLCPGSFHLKPESYAKAQFPDILRLPSGKQLRRPSNWTST